MWDPEHLIPLQASLACYRVRLKQSYKILEESYEILKEYYKISKESYEISKES
jgi:hypothetical protein